MSDHKCTLKAVLDKVAKEQGFVNYTIDIKPISSEGANYSSVLFLATISENGKGDIKLFNKVSCVGEKVRAVAPFQIFQSEICFYNELIKLYKDMELKYGVPEEHKFIAPKFYGSSDEYLKETLVMEDLTAIGYEMFDRFKTFDYNYAKESVRQLAKFHALSIAYSIKEPEDFEIKTQKLKMQNNMDALSAMIQGVFENVLKSLREEFKDRVQSFLKEIMTDGKLDYLTQPHRRMVLAHGDFRASNIMHKLNEVKILYSRQNFRIFFSGQYFHIIITFFFSLGRNIQSDSYRLPDSSPQQPYCRLDLLHLQWFRPGI